ncbi:MAG: hypothetical protein K2G03_05825, partial [Bacilli bacterium]|nr:hypothetical protein [Bacilli bacterium]
MNKIYDFTHVINAIRKDFNPYNVLGISSDTPDEVIIRMWNRYRNRNMSSQIKLAFEMLVVPVNKFVYDRLMDYVSKKGKTDIFAYASHVEDELGSYIARMEDDIVYNTKKDFESMIQFGRNRLSMDDPSTGIEQLEHVARYTKNNEGFWFYSKDLKIEGSDAVVDIYKREDKYVYYIR